MQFKEKCLKENRRKFFKETIEEGFTGGAVVKNCQCRGHGFELSFGKIPHAMEQLSPCTTTTEPAL